MSSRPGRLRKYGKAGRSACAVDRVFLDSASPRADKSDTARTVLQEASGNACRTARRPQISPKKASRSDQTRPAADAADPPAAGAGRSTRDHSEAPKPAETELAQQIAALELEPSSSDEGEPPAEAAAGRPPEIRRHSVTLTGETETYLDPLLRCRGVSKIVESFQHWMDERASFLALKKIGEGSFGEVYRAEGVQTVILKLMPLNAKKGKGSRSFTSIESARNEVRLLSRMSKVPGFVEFRGACVLQGRMPTQLIQQWDAYLDSGRTVESRSPHKRDSYPPTQLWMLVEMSDAGQSLESGDFAPSRTIPAEGRTSDSRYLPTQHAWDIFWQVAKALAKGEVFASYEHRDLHLGNICVSTLR